MKIGVLGYGSIGEIYVENITNVFREVEFVGVYDIVDERAEKAVATYGGVKYKSMDEMFNDSQVDIVLNLTQPKTHYETNIKAINAGKHVYTEKPLGISYDEGNKQVVAALARGVRIGGAPDTFLGAGIQTCRKLIEDGHIGTPIGFTAFVINRGPEAWHPDPEFIFKHGCGPVFDMGPYYLTALVNMLGSIKSVTAMTKTTFDVRTITSKPNFGKKIEVEVPTYANSILNFESGVIGSFFVTYDVHATTLPCMEIYGTEGTLLVPDPNFFDGPIKLFRPQQGEFTEVPLLFDYSKNYRGIGIADMAKAIVTGREHRANGNLMLHVLEILEGIVLSGKEGRTVNIETPYIQTPPMINTELFGILA